MAGSVITRLQVAQPNYVDLTSNQVVSGTKVLQLIQTPQVPTNDNDVINKNYYDILLNYTSGIGTLSEWTQLHLAEVESYASGTAGTGSGSNPALETYASGINILSLDNQQRITTLEAATGLTRLTNDLTIYVNSDTGSDITNTGESGSPFQTIQYSIDHICNNYDLVDKRAFIKLYDGTYVHDGRIICKSFYGKQGAIRVNVLSGASITVAGNADYPERTNVVFSGITSGFYSETPCPYIVQDMKITLVSRVSGYEPSINCQIQGCMAYNNLIFAGNQGIPLIAQYGGKIFVAANDTPKQINIAAKNIYSLARSIVGSFIAIDSTNVIFSERVTTTRGFVWAEQLGEISAQNTTFSGQNAATVGPKYEVSLNSLIYTNTNNASFFPGNTNGSNTNHVQYY